MDTQTFYGHPDFYTITQDELSLHSAKNKDYAQGGDPLGNFHRVSEIKKLYPGFPWDSPTGVALGYMLKQLDAAFWMLAKGYEGEVEDVDTRLRDVHVYTKLARILHREEKPKYIIGTDPAQK
jgi:hypothetical protein